MPGDHSEVDEPTFVIPLVMPLKLLECESCNVFCQLVLGKDLCRYFLNVVLFLNHANDHALEDLICLASVGVRRRQLPISQRIVAIIKLCDVSAKVLDNGELASRVNLLIPCGSQDKVVTND